MTFQKAAPVCGVRQFLTSLFRAAVDAADPVRAISAHLPAKPRGRVVVVGAGKGAAQMARALETSGIVLSQAPS